MFGSSGQSKPRTQSSRRKNYRVECFADDDDDDSDSPYFEPTDLSDTDFCSCVRSTANHVESPRRDRTRRQASRRPSQVPCAVEADSLPLARPIPLPYDSDVFDTWCNRSRKPKRHSGGEKYQENRGDGLCREAGAKLQASPSRAPPPPPSPETLARLISRSLLRHTAAGAAAAAPTATTPRYYRRSTREASRRPSRLCLPGTSQPDPALGGRRQSMHVSRSQPLAAAASASSKPPVDAQQRRKQLGEVKIPVQAHVSYVARADDSPRSGAANTRRQPPRGEIRIPLDVFAAPFLAGPDAAHWTQQLHKASSSRAQRSHTKVHPQRSHMRVQHVHVDVTPHASASGKRAAPLRKRRSVVGSRPRAASDKPPQKHRTPSIRSRASETILPQAVQSNLDALLTSYESQLAMPPSSAARHASCTTHGIAAAPWGHRPDPRLIPVHLLKPRKPESVRQREFLAILEERIRAAAKPLPKDAQPAELESKAAQGGAQQEEQAKESGPAVAAAAALSAESKLNSLLNDLVRNGFDVSSLEQKATGVATAATAKAEVESKAEVKTTNSAKGSKLQLDPRRFYETLYNQQTLARVDFSQHINECKATTPAELKAQVEMGCSRHKMAGAERRDWQSGDKQRRPRSKPASECANYSQDEESVYENQDFWDTLDLNVDLNSVQSLSDGFEGHEDGYKYFRNGQVPSANPPVTPPTTVAQNVVALADEQARLELDTPLQELWRHSERPPVRAKSAKPVVHPAASSPRPPHNGEYFHWPNYKGKSGTECQTAQRSREASNECHDETRVASTIAEPSTPATSNGLVGGDDAQRINVSKSFIAEVVEETLDRRNKSCKRIPSQAKMNVGQAIELIKRKSSSMNDALCMEIAKALSDRLIDCESAKSEKEYVMQLKKLRSDHLRHISREVKRLQDLEGFLDDFGHVRTMYDTACTARDQQGE